MESTWIKKIHKKLNRLNLAMDGWREGGRDALMDGEREREMDKWMDESIDGGRERVRRG